MSSVSPTGTTATSAGSPTGTTATAGPSSSSSSTTSGVSSLITSTGIGSGLDITSIVSTLTSSFGAAQTAQLDAQQQTLNSQVTAYGQFTTSVDKLKSALQDLMVSSKLAAFQATVGDNKIASATAATGAVAGTYSLQVDKLATSAALNSKAFTSATATVGTGTLTVGMGGKTFDVNIDITNNSLQGIASAINGAVNNTGVTAGILTTTEGARLVLSGSSTGAANAVTVTQTGGDGNLASLTYDPAHNVTNLKQTQAAQDASFSINGFPASSASNAVSGVLQGVTFNLLSQSAAGTPTTLTVAPDSSAASQKISDFVSALNDTLSTIKSLTAYDPTTRYAGALNGDATLEGFQNQLQSLLGKVVSGSTNGVKSLGDLGLSANADGSYSLNTDKLTSALSGNVAGVSSLLTGTAGLASQIDTFVNGYTKTGGILDSINQGLLSGLKTVSRQQSDLATQLSAYSARLTAQYNAMDTAVAKLKSMQQYLTAQFNAQNNSSSSSSSRSG